MTKQLVRKELFEVHKPSTFITMEYERTIRNDAGKIIGSENNLTSTQHDAMNFLCYTAREQLHKKYPDLHGKFKSFNNDEELFEFLEIQKFEINLKDLSEFLEKYEFKQDKKKLSYSLNELKSTTVRVGIFKQDSKLKEVLENRYFSLLRRYNRVSNSNTVTYQLEPEILLGWAFNPKPFAKMYLKLQTNLHTTYTKILYEICKDYENLKVVRKELDLWHAVLGFNKDIKTIHQVSLFKHNYLNRAIEDINKFTDIKITNIYGEKKDKKTFMIVEFEKQSVSRLKELGLVESGIISLPFYSKAKKKLDTLIKGGYKVADEEMWIKTDIKKNEEKYDSETRIDTWLKETTQSAQNEIYKLLASSIDECEDISVYIKDYLICGILTNELFTKSAKETIDALNAVIDENFEIEEQ